MSYQGGLFFKKLQKAFCLYLQLSLFQLVVERSTSILIHQLVKGIVQIVVLIRIKLVVLLAAIFVMGHVVILVRELVALHA